MILKLDGLPNPRQREFFMAKARHIAYGGARGGGKSWAVRRKFILLALRYPKLKLLLLRRTLPELRENHLLPLLSELHSVARYNEGERAFTFPGGSRIKLGYCDAERDVYQYQGQEYDVVALEEATHFTESQGAVSRHVQPQPRARISPRACITTCNPGNVGHAWVKRLFIDRDYTRGEREADYVFIPARVYDNKALLLADPGYLVSLENLPENCAVAHLHGDWDVHSGQYFNEFRRAQHVIEPFSAAQLVAALLLDGLGLQRPVLRTVARRRRRR